MSSRSLSGLTSKNVLFPNELRKYVFDKGWLQANIAHTDPYFYCHSDLKCYVWTFSDSELSLTSEEGSFNDI